MARDYNSKRSSRRGTSVPHQLLVIAVTFVLGYFTASIFDVNALSHWLTTQVLESHEAKMVRPQAQAMNGHTKKEETVAKPKFEFYTLLANEKGVAAANNARPVASATTTAPEPAKVMPTNPQNISAPAVTTAVTVAHAVPVPAPAKNSTAEIKKQQTTTNQPAFAAGQVHYPGASQGRYIVQVAAFKARHDAEHMKGTLILKGFEVSVIPTTTAAKGVWYRVVIGPYPNRVLAQKAQVILAKKERLHGMVRSV